MTGFSCSDDVIRELTPSLPAHPSLLGSILWVAVSFCDGPDSLQPTSYQPTTSRSGCKKIGAGSHWLILSHVTDPEPITVALSCLVFIGWV